MRVASRAAAARFPVTSGTPPAGILALAVAGWIVFHRALAVFFSQDDFQSLARVTGLLPRMSGPWRYVGNQLVFDALHPIAGLDPRPYHLASLLAHVGCAALLFVLLARRVSRPAAFGGAAFFVVHPMLYTSVYWVSVIADSLALLFALAALIAAEAHRWKRWLALPLFALSLLSKESTILLPLVMLVLPPPRAHTPPDGVWVRRPDPLAMALGAVAIVYLVYFVTSAYARFFLAHDAAAGSAQRAAYGLASLPMMMRNMLTYVGWTVTFLIPLVHAFADAPEAGVFPAAVGMILLWVAGLAWPALRRHGWLAGGLVFLLFLLPVLPLRNHVYHYYLVAPMAGAAWCVAALLETAFQRVTWRAAWSASVALAVLLTWNGYLLVAKIEYAPFLRPELRADAITDRALIAERVAEDLRAAHLPAGTRLAFWSPYPAGSDTSAASAAVATGGRGESYFERNVRTALLDGLAVRVLVPEVRGVAFTREFHALPQPWRYAVYRLDGRLRVATSAELESLLALHPVR
jgi:hypothetical protein